MTSNLDLSFAEAPSLEPDFRTTFERVSSECDAREHSDSDAECSSVWLECNGELVDCGAVDMLGIRKSTLGVEMLEFVCPCCEGRHESLRFGRVGANSARCRAAVRVHRESAGDVRDGRRTNDGGSMQPVVRGVGNQDIEALA
jgi:hypothetical protein